MQNVKSPQESYVVMHEMILPNDTNCLNNLMGGRVLYWMDIAGGIAAQKHANRIVVTASVDSVSFSHPVQLGDVIQIEAIVTRAFQTSMEVRLIVWTQNFASPEKIKANEAYYTFVALDEQGKTTRVPEIIPKTDIEKKLYKTALHRRQLRLIYAGRLKPRDASELKTLFDAKEEI